MVADKTVSKTGIYLSSADIIKIIKASGQLPGTDGPLPLWCGIGCGGYRGPGPVDPSIERVVPAAGKVAKKTRPG